MSAKLISILDLICVSTTPLPQFDESQSSNSSHWAWNNMKYRDTVRNYALSIWSCIRSRVSITAGKLLRQSRALQTILQEARVKCSFHDVDLDKYGERQHSAHVRMCRYLWLNCGSLNFLFLIAISACTNFNTRAAFFPEHSSSNFPLIFTSHLHAEIIRRPVNKLDFSSLGSLGFLRKDVYNLFPSHGIWCCSIIIVWPKSSLKLKKWYKRLSGYEVNDTIYVPNVASTRVYVTRRSNIRDLMRLKKKNKQSLFHDLPNLLQIIRTISSIVYMQNITIMNAEIIFDSPRAISYTHISILRVRLRINLSCCASAIYTNVLPEWFVKRLLNS